MASIVDKGDGARVTVEFRDETYIIKSDAPVEYVQSLASELERRLDNIARANPAHPLHRIAILAALNVMDEACKWETRYKEALALLDRRA